MLVFPDQVFSWKLLSLFICKIIIIIYKIQSLILFIYSYKLKDQIKFQYLISEMEHNFECAKPHEKMIYQRYVDKCAMFYAGSTVTVFLGASVAIFAPLIAADKIFPTDAKYPFDVEHEPVRTIIYLNQFVVIWQCFSIVCLCSFVGLLIWFAAVRFEILSQEFRAVTDTYGITVCVRQHIKLLR